MKHTLKTVQPYFNDVIRGHKTFEIRKNDRNFKINDILELIEYHPNFGFLGGEALFEVVYITDYEQKPNYVVLGIRRVE